MGEVVQDSELAELDRSEEIASARDEQESWHLQLKRDALEAEQARREKRAQVASERKAARLLRSGTQTKWAGYTARYRRFDLTTQDHVDELERIVTGSLTGINVIREERYSKEDTVLTLAWLEPSDELLAKKEKLLRNAEAERERHIDPDTGLPFLIQPPPGPGIPDDEDPLGGDDLLSIFGPDHLS